MDDPAAPCPSDPAAIEVAAPTAAPVAECAPECAPECATEPQLVHLHMPVDVRSLSLAVLAALATLYALHAASAVCIPLLLGLAGSYALSPVVDRLERLHIPRALGAALLIASLGALVGWTAYSLSDDANSLIESLPDATRKIREAVRAQRGQSETTIDKVQRAAAQLEQAAQEGTAPLPAATRGVTRVSIERARFDIKDYLWSGSLGAATSVGQALAVVFITYFLLASGSSFRRKMVKIAGPTFARKRITVQVLDEITGQIHRYLLVQVFTSLVVGLVTWLAFWAVGLEHAAVWGVVAVVLNFIPYIGSLLIAVGSAMVAIVQFSSVDMAMAVGGIAVLIHLVSGNLLTPWLMSRTSRMNAVAVFVGVLFFGWLWGIWGLLLGVPVLTAVKAVCDRVDDLKPIGELLGA